MTTLHAHLRVLDGRFLCSLSMRETCREEDASKRQGQRTQRRKISRWPLLADDGLKTRRPLHERFQTYVADMLDELRSGLGGVESGEGDVCWIGGEPFRNPKGARTRQPTSFQSKRLNRHSRLCLLPPSERVSRRLQLFFGVSSTKPVAIGAFLYPVSLVGEWDQRSNRRAKSRLSARSMWL